MEAFEDASARVSSGELGSMSTKTQLRLYGLYSLIHKGPAPSTAPNSWIDPRGAAKWKAWSEASSKTREDAMLEYVKLVEALERGDEDAVGTIDSSDDEANVLQSGFGGTGLKGYDEIYSEEDEKLTNKQAFAQRLDLSHWASMGDARSVEYVLAKEGSEIIDRKDEMGMTALMRAADRNKIEVIEVLLEKGAQVDATDADGQTALHYATFCGHLEATSKLLSAGASIEKKDNDGKTPLDLATDEVKRFLEIQENKALEESPKWQEKSEDVDRASEGNPTFGFRLLNEMSQLERVILGVSAISVAWFCIGYIKEKWMITS